MNAIGEIGTLELPYPLNLIKIRQTFNFGLFRGPSENSFLTNET